ncbi:MAG: alanine dehydrogenase, partial [Bacteroidetes bacterium]|nr:alanine dehydrogenase [Bacteroidota bacterium]
MNKDTRSSNFSLSSHGLLPQEEILEVGKKREKLIIGIPCEDPQQENRLALTPEAVDLLVGNGHEVLIEKGAGKNVSYSDTDFSEKGGFIVDTSERVYKADVILKVAPLTLKEINFLKGQQLVFSSLQIAKQSEKIIRALVQKKITAIAFENIMDKHDLYPVVRSMSEIAGITSVLVAAEYLSNVRGGKGVMLGGITGITPAEVVILGAGTAAEYATRAALGLGATVKIFDQSVHCLREIQNLIGHRLQTSVFHPQVLEKNLKSADVV